ncbi:Peroxisomal bifunctional enzyme [Hondaea fermentalgiana]|uniref:Peroxisomal bifunctional enzyme n=1 Tax=Hondaea fermentalgiana TaxID=2315210 RepID=A0A2R5G137_9STRA|nr:Peroxisomal bifunctional enzyme [Hondaea fermentalgiana]|eukprot:GBG24720.1 Peroxisomal bifunctional enzyme [Hondaea fermentalgiana]
MSKYALKQGVAIVTASNPPVNGLSRAVRQGLVQGLKQAQQDGAKSVVILGEGATFPAGADIKEFASGAWNDDPDLNQVFAQLDASDIPVVAAIHGNALGGGLETALSCNYRVALSSAKVGLPEVHLGILPGAGGTQRLPRVVGVEQALEMIGTGKPIGASVAHKLGIVDEIIEGKTADELLAGAIKFAESVSDKKPVPRISERTVEPVDDDVYVSARVKFAKIARGQEAPQKIVDAVRAAVESARFDAGLKEEARLFQELMDGSQSKAMQYMFFAERSCNKVPGIDSKKALEVKHVGVIGGGTMGRGIAMCFANKGIRVTLSETSEEALQGAKDAIEGLYKKSSAFRSGRMSEADVAARMELIEGTTDPEYKALAECDAVIEAVFENLDLKKKIFGQLGKICKESALLASNTSYLDIDEIAQASGRPEMFLGMHFFSPANVMPALENVRGSASSEVAIATAMNMGKRIGKTTMLAGNCFGFIGNRMFEPYTQAAIGLVEEGALPSQVDRVLGPQPGMFGMAMGPLAVLDLAGNDIGQRIRAESYYPHTAENVKGARGATGRLGQKTGAGWYKYEGRSASDDEAVNKLCDEHRENFGIPKRSNISDQEILERVLYPMINEGFRILEENIASRPSDIDVLYNAGYGFPRYRGGPMFYADLVGLDTVRDGLLRIHDANPELPHWHFQPAQLLEDLVASRTTLAEHWIQRLKSAK